LTSGKTTIKSIFSKGKPEEQKKKLEEENVNLNNEAQHASQLVDIICALLGFLEIDKYK